MTKHLTLEITPMAFQEIRRRLEKAGQPVGADDAIDMNGCTLKPLSGAAGLTDLQVSSLLSNRTKSGVVELSVNGERTQMDLDKAREVLGMLSQAIEAAVSDQLLYEFLTQKVGLSGDQAAAALLDFRELRQGTRGISRPQ